MIRWIFFTCWNLKYGWLLSSLKKSGIYIVLTLLIRHSCCQSRILSTWSFSRRLITEVSFSDGRPTRIKAVNSLVKLSAGREIHAHQTEGEDKVCWSLFSVLSATSSPIHGIFWATLNRGLLPIQKPTLHRQSGTQAGVRLQTSFNNYLKCWFFLFLWITVCGKTGDCSLEGCAGSEALWFWIRNSSWSPLCSSHETLHFKYRQGVNGTARKNPCGQNLEINVSIQ